MALSAKEEFIAQCMTGQGKTREECEQMYNEAHKTDQESKTAFIEQCMAGGKSREECEAAWKEGREGADYATLVRELEMTKVKLDQTQKMLREATEIIKAVNAERDAVQEARKYEIAVELERDSDGRMKHGDLMKENLETLSVMKKAVDTAKPKDFISVASMATDSMEAKKPKLTVGQYNPDTKKYEGGI